MKTRQGPAKVRRRWASVAAITALATLVAAVSWHGSGDRADIQAQGPVNGSEPGLIMTESQARVAAVKAGKPVEIPSRGTERQATYANPDGSFTHDSYAEPFRARRAGKWLPLDTTMVRHRDGTVGPRTAVTGMRFSGGGDAPLASISKAGRVMHLSWPDPLPVPELSGDSATYRDVLPEVDLVLHATATGFSHVLVVRTRRAAKLPRLRTVSYRLSGQNLRFAADAHGRLVAKDIGSDQTVFETPAPRMWDAGDPAAEAAAGQRYEPARSAPESARGAMLGVRVKGGTLRLIADARLLADPATRFPLYIDPYVNPTSNTSWAVVDSGYPSQEYWKFAGKADERVGLCPVSRGGCYESKVKRLLFTLPTPYQDDRIVVSSATFKITMMHAYDSTSRAVSLYRTGSFSSATNWNNQPGGNEWPAANRLDTRSTAVTQADCTPTNQNVLFTATAAARSAASANWAATTFGIAAGNERDDKYTKRFCGNAVLSVTYNRPPAAPTSLATSPGGACKSGTQNATWYVSSVPKLSAYLSDPDTGDAEPLTARFTVNWTPPGGTQQTKTWVSGAKANKSTFDYHLADRSSGVPALPENVVVSWRAEAYDGNSWSTASVTCKFILDKTKPAGPDIDSAAFLPADAAETTPGCVESAEWIDGVGRYGSFVFDSAATDVVSYKYGFDGDPSPSNLARPKTDGGPATVIWSPLTEAPHFVTVNAVDRAGKESDTSVCHFNVAPGPAVAKWNLADAAGSAQAADERTANPALAGPGVSFQQPGPGGAAHPAAQLDGSAGGYLNTSGQGLVNTSKEFAVSAWVKLDDLSRPQTAVSQDGTGQPGFHLGYRPDNGGRWLFAVPSSDVRALGAWEVTSARTVTADTGWTHLAGVFDPIADTVSLYVNGTRSATAPARSQWESRGGVQLGRRANQGTHGSAWQGGLADVAVYDRLLTGAEVTAIAAPRLQRQVYWSLDSADVPDDNPGVWISPETVNEGATPDLERSLTLYNGAELMIPDPDDIFATPALVGAGHMVLDGVDAYAGTTAELAGQTGSFSVSVRAQLAAACANDQVVISQRGAKVSRFQVKCANVGGQMRWQLVLADGDAVGTATTVVTDGSHIPDPDDTDGQHLVVTWNAFAREALLYVDGELAAGAQGTHDGVWDGPDRGVQIGRALLNGSTTKPSYGSYFSGVIDEVRFYSGVLDPVTVSRLSSTTAQSDL